jgi:hypothetical protein
MYSCLVVVVQDVRFEFAFMKDLRKFIKKYTIICSNKVSSRSGTRVIVSGRLTDMEQSIFKEGVLQFVSTISVLHNL